MNDTVAPPFDPVKMVARMQAEATDGGPYLLLRCATPDTAAAPPSPR